MPSKLKKAIGAVKDQTSISLAKVSSNNSSNLEVAVLKATTHDNVPIDEHYVYEVLQLISSNKIYAAACARAIGKRITRTRNWIVALKSLMLVLRIFQDGDPYFPREVLHAMKRGAKILNLSNFRDDSNSSPWDYTAFVRTFALYLDERLDCFLTGKLQRRYTHKEREGSHSYKTSRRTNDSVREMKPSILLDRILYWQRLLERAIATRPTGPAKANRLVQISLYAVVRESFDLYKDISDGLTLILDSFFHLQYQSCVSAFQTCVKAAKQFEELKAFYAVCKTIGVGRTSEYPSVQTISEELIETLQEFLKDQSSFPTHIKLPNKQLLLPAPSPLASTSGRHDSYGGQSEFSEISMSTEKASDYGSQCTSLEDLISATENGKTPSISIDLEAYSDQFEKKSQRDDQFRVSDTGSSRSLPVSNSMFDLLSLDDWPEEEQECQEQQTQLDVLQQSSSAKGWELVLAEVMSPLTQSLPNQGSSSSGDFPKPEQEHNNSFDPFSEQDQQEQNREETCSREGWEIVLAETATQSTQQTSILSNTLDASSINTLYDQTPLPATHYNPFLQETNDLAIIPVVSSPAAPIATGFEVVFPSIDVFLLAPTFQASPTFSAQNPNNGTFHTTPTFTAHNLNNGTFQATPTFTAQNLNNRIFQATPTFMAQNPNNSMEGTFQASPTFLTQNPNSTAAGTLQATPTFSAQNPNGLHNEHDPFATPNNAVVPLHYKNDPFESDMASEQMFNGSTNQQNFLQEQQLWLQQQNKIIARHMTNV